VRKSLKQIIAEKHLRESVSQGRRAIVRQMKSDLDGLNTKAQNYRSISAFHKDCLATATRVDDAEHSQFMSDVNKDIANRVQAHADELAAKIKAVR